MTDIFLYDGRIVEQGTKTEILQKQQMNKETSLEQIYMSLIGEESIMQEYRKLLCVNKIRETKRLIENMLIPILSLVVAAAVVGYQIVINFFQ